MKLEEVYENLCVYDERSPHFGDNPFPEDATPRNDCYCDSCFNGCDLLALEIIELKAKIAKIENKA